MASPLRTSPAGGSSPVGAPVGALEWTLFVVLCITVAVYWAFQYEPFVLPNNDYASFQDTAKSLAALELPRHFQRMPMFPALMGIAAPLLPGDQPYLDAALAVNLACSMGVLILVFVLGARAFGRGALLPPLLLAGATQFHSMALQPLVEPSLAFFVVLAFVLFQARSPWQYAAAFAAGLGRYEAVILIPVLFIGNLAVDRRFFTHAALSALAASGFVGWTALGWLHGSGGSTYYDLMQGMGFRAAPDFFERSFKEPFRGWYREPGEGLWIFLLAVGIPLAAGLRAGLREFRREAAALFAFFVLCVAVIVIFGINKARYVFPTEWIPIFFFALGALRLAQAAERLLARAPVAVAGAVTLAAGLALAWVGRRWGLRILATEGAQPAPLDAAFFAALLALAAVALAVYALRRPRLPAAAAALALLALLTPQLAGGVHAKRKELFKVMYENWGSYVAAQWLERNLGPEERALVVSPNHIEHLTGLGEERVAGFASCRAANVEDLREEMKARGVRYALYTWRKTPETPSDRYYHDRLKAFLSEAFRSGAPIQGFDHVATLPLPAELERDAVQVYRVSDEAGG